MTDGPTAVPDATPNDDGPGEDPPQCYRHPGRETYVRCVRCDRSICPDCMHSASVGFQCPECVREGARTVRKAQTAYGGRVATTPYVTYALIAVNVAVFLATAVSGTTIGFGSGKSSLYGDFAAYPPAIANGEYYRMLTSMFLHYGLLHIVFNMYALMYVGPTLERLLGAVRFTGLYFVAGFGGSVLSYVAGSIVQQSAGASGAIFGLFGAFFIVIRQQRLDPRGIAGLIGINLVLGFLIPNVDIYAHLGGLASGAAVAAALVYPPRGRSRTLVQVVGVLLVVALLVAITYLRTDAIRELPVWPLLPK